MKKIFTLALLACLAALNFSYGQCSVGGNGVASNTNIQVNGDMTDWTAILNDQDNITNDATPDTDAPISDVGRDFTRFAFTENISTLFLYFQRAGSVNNSVDLLFYVDVNNNGLMQTNEPVVAISWGGSNGNTQVDIYNYTQVAAGGDAVSGDGWDMPGTLSLRVKLGALGKGSINGVSLEVGIPFTELYKKGTTTNADSLAPIEQFKFHISSINGSVASVPGSNSVNDNFGGCFSGFMTLPVKISRLEAQIIKNNAVITWEVQDNENAAIFEIESSVDGKNYSKTGMIYATDKTGVCQYSFTTPLTHNKTYYRLKITDKDKYEEYSRALFVTQKNAGAENVLQLNNPVYSGLTIKYGAATRSSAVIKIYHSSGALVYSQKQELASGANTWVVSDTYLRTKGSYIVEITNQNNEKVIQKILKL